MITLARLRAISTKFYMERSWIGWTMAITAALGFSIAPVVSRGALLEGMKPSTLVMARMVLSVFVLGGFLLFYSPDLLKVDRRGFLIALSVGIFNAFGFLAFNIALTRLEASIASMIFTLNPLVVLLLLALRGEKLTHRHIVRLTLGLAGVYLLIGPSGRVDFTGVVMVIITVIVFASQLVIMQWFLQGYHAWTISFYVVLGIAIVSSFYWLLDGGSWINPGKSGWAAIIALTLVSTFLARVTMYAGVQYLGSGQISLTVPLETFFTVTWSFLFLHERLNIIQWVGGTLILLSMILAINRLRLSRKKLRWRIWTRL